ncbi:MAG: hypothetical protein EAZ74_00360 [Alphaproteobacteria bacterium]|nr:MAG: hypothetical protein EAY76_02830 [Alphaproteobacteria bacterium]TAF16002.1 MAG: hypothetical protein EAZ74_00360 [Alphaproteobacteria bacterium]TAF76225.1 MAG: hypothetical protein EAZ52_04830 [Alphaproteobacteria bacterium]
MEILPINPDEVLKPRPVHPFGAVDVKKRILPESAHTTYRVQFEDGTHRDVQADHAREAYQMIQQEHSATPIKRIFHLRYLTEDVIPPVRTQLTAHEVRVEIEPKIHSKGGHMMVEIPPKPMHNFDVMEYDDLAQIYAEERLVLSTHREEPKSLAYQEEVADAPIVTDEEVKNDE